MKVAGGKRVRERHPRYAGPKQLPSPLHRMERRGIKGEVRVFKRLCPSQLDFPTHPQILLTNMKQISLRTTIISQLI